jgi:PKHD-type hydroxylase
LTDERLRILKGLCECPPRMTREGVLGSDLTGLLSTDKMLLAHQQTWPAPFHHETSAKPLFTPAECSRIVQIGLGLSPSRASVEARGVRKARRWIRNSRISSIVSDDSTHWIFQIIETAVAEANLGRWHYDLVPLVFLQFTEYGPGGHYLWHVDVGPGKNIFRKLSFSVQLSSPATYIGGKLQFLRGHYRRTASTELGSLTIFPSFMLHRVKPVLFGRRYSLVGWVQGPEPLR